jgi:hypothetical protein
VLILLGASLLPMVVLIGDRMARAPPQTVILPTEFLHRSPGAEQTEIVQATSADSKIQLWMWNLAAAENIDLTDPLTISGPADLVQQNLITAARQTRILRRSFLTPSLQYLLIGARNWQVC